VIVRAGELDIKENYKLLISSVVPRPIAFVSTLSTDGVPNLAPFSFFTAMTARPPTIGFVSSRRSGETVKKDTLHNIESGGEFVINIVTEYIAEQMHRTSGDYAPEIDEFALSSLSPVPSLMVKPPRVSESPINLECKLYRMVEIGDGEPGSGTLIIGEIIIYHVDDRLLVNGRIDPTLLKPVGKLAGSEYSTLGLRFTMG
jgi:flavin reductase (DIM6/NTAB) family NADH-FMN oxidoreductase RutF